MKGIELVSLTGELRKVSPRWKKPICAVRNARKKLGGKVRLITECGDGFSFLNDCHKLPIEAFVGFSFDELCKIRYSAGYFMHDSVVKLFESDSQYEVIRKIDNSMWRWGFGHDVWNEVVDAYDCIRRFSFGNLPNFEIRLDHSTYHNEYGYSKYSRTFIDGAFAFLVYYKGKHVMTIGFSIVHDKGVLIQQVQLTQRTGNRFLYKLPGNRLEYVISMFGKNFPDYRLYIVDGRDLTKRFLRNYAKAFRSALEKCKQTERRMAEECDDESRKKCEAQLEEDRKYLAMNKDSVLHMRRDRKRIAAFYNDVGAFSLDRSVVFEANRTKHYLIEKKD